MHVVFGHDGVCILHGVYAWCFVTEIACGCPHEPGRVVFERSSRAYHGCVFHRGNGVTGLHWTTRMSPRILPCSHTDTSLRGAEIWRFRSGLAGVSWMVNYTFPPCWSVLGNGVWAAGSAPRLGIGVWIPRLGMRLFLRPQERVTPVGICSVVADSCPLDEVNQVGSLVIQ